MASVEVIKNARPGIPDREPKVREIPEIEDPTIPDRVEEPIRIPEPAEPVGPVRVPREPVPVGR